MAKYRKRRPRNGKDADNLPEIALGISETFYASDEELAGAFNITDKKLAKWKKEHPNFKSQIAAGRRRYHFRDKVRDGYRMGVYNIIARNICAAVGADPEELAEVFGLSEETIRRWISQYEEFKFAVKYGQEEYNVRLAEDHKEASEPPRKHYRIHETKTPSKDQKEDRGIFRDEYTELAYHACRINYLNDEELARFFGVRQRTIRTWRANHQYFDHMIQEGKRWYAMGHPEDCRVPARIRQTALNRRAQIEKLPVSQFLAGESDEQG